MVDITQVTKNGQKKTRSVSSAILVGGSTAALAGGSYANTTSNYDLFNLPPNALVTDAYIVTDVAGQATLTCDLGFDGGAELINDADIDNTGVVKDAGIKLATGTGKLVTAKFSAAPTVGRFIAVVEYIEYTKANGDLTKFS